MSREGDATLDRRARQRSIVAWAARQSDQGGSESHNDHDDGSRSPSPQPRRRPKAAKRDGASVSAGDVWSSICMSGPQWAADTDSKAGSKGKTVITKSEHQSNVAGVRWHEKNQAWMASWCEKGGSKEKIKYFSVRDHGFDTAKVRTTPPVPSPPESLSCASVRQALAEQHRREMESAGCASVRKLSKHRSGVKGVFHDKRKNCWKAGRRAAKRRRSPSQSLSWAMRVPSRPPLDIAGRWRRSIIDTNTRERRPPSEWQRE
ncbi:unnamed protein product [Vitrella brassicaformis CCMP3155]|uniref:AP2/ERF domain-containing protein n=1 Tax=Vitrella brassicaformis (strain CCMP3155) TaxID=1169540 RepID=A0A0G4G385_VITBC|nr:unnamed protein product [Vitrella brassicaformis CCMP3155]|eukprot:CEM22593.1 unnamed protein product [Vitrella brassicaformis CCMP3155]